MIQKAFLSCLCLKKRNRTKKVDFVRFVLKKTLRFEIIGIALKLWLVSMQNQKLSIVTN